MNPGDFELVKPTSNLVLETFPVGDIFNTFVNLGLQTKYRAWHINIPSSNMGRREIGCKICARYGLLSHYWVIVINGQMRAMDRGEMIGGEIEISFKLFDQIFVLSIIRHNIIKVKMVLKMNGYEMKEIRKTADIITGEQSPPTLVSIPSARTSVVNSRPITVYRICCEISNKEKVIVERRYSEFFYLHAMVMGHTGKHLRSTLPSLPSRVFNPFVDQKCTDFINIRREALQTYLNGLLANSKVVCYTEVLCFLGLDPMSAQPQELLPSVDGAFSENSLLKHVDPRLLSGEFRDSISSITLDD
mmetsp:Transcript_23028/g.38432  ORF Transcript_23028/g.38432 Transcript_23028/m.38432 type:complete len:303 (-) Transcript_23028:200-1108(-)